MAQFSVKPDQARSTVDTESRLIRELGDIENEIRSIGNSLGFEVAAKANIRYRLNSATNQISGYQSSMGQMHSALNNVINTYNRTENAIVGNSHVGNAELVNVSGGGCGGDGGDGRAPGDQDAGKADLSKLWKAVGVFGPLGKTVSSIGKVVTGDQSTLAKWGDAVSGIWKSGWKIGETIVKCKKDASINWLQAIVGFNKNSFLKSIKDKNLGWPEKALNGWGKQIKGTLREFKTTKGLVKQIGGIIVSGVTNSISNYEEHQRGEISAGRAVVETVVETAVDWGKDLLIGAGAMAGLAAFNLGAPVFVVGGATLAVSAGVDWVSKKICGKKLTEAVSDFVIDKASDAASWAKNQFETGAKKVKEGAAAVWKSIAGGWSTLTGSRKLAFG